jgi:hypothetical protein
MSFVHAPLRALALAITAVAVGCTAGPVDEPVPDTSYHRDIRPIIEARCASCHLEGGIGPVPLTTYQEVADVAEMVETMVASRLMPPWLGAQGCRDYEDDPTLSDDQIALISAWVAEGAPEGYAADFAPLDVQSAATEEEPLVADVIVPMPEPYTPPSDVTDDYRCFVVDWPATTTQYVTGYDTTPGELAIVHHVIAYYVAPEYAQDAVDVDESEPGVGYECFGGPRAGDGLWLAAWAPGGRASRYPEGTGLRVDPGAKIVLQIHYNLRNGALPDQSSVSFELADSVEKEGFLVPFANPDWFEGMNMLIPAGEADVVHMFELDLATATETPITVYSASLHMHELGRNAATWVETAGGTRECLLDIPRWDFGWQLTYGFQEPLVVGPGDRLMLECRFDNSAGNQPIVNGERLPPRDVGWGENTGDEMCLAVFYITE